MAAAPRFPIGVQLAAAARAVERSFDAVLAQSGGSIPVWLVLLNLKLRRTASQRELAEAIGVQTSTLSIHLSQMERDGLVVRHREPEDRRTHVVGLTAAGEAAFARIRSAAGAFDSALRRGLTDAEVDQLEHVLGVLVANASRADDGGRRSAREFDSG